MKLAVATSKALFYHVGKTGGHSVRHMLWRANLIERQVQPMHIRPKELRQLHPELGRRYAFCFVRHPLDWLASVWVHNMSYGPTDPTMPDESTFPRFLDAIADRHPGGAVSERLQEYVDACDFVGTLEHLGAGVVRALRRAGEDFDDADIIPIALNDGTVPELKKAARASHATLDYMLEKDRGFAKRFGYDFVPKHLSNEAPTLSLPMLSLRNRPPVWEERLPTTDAVFDHPVWLSNGLELPAEDSLRRYSWQVWVGLKSLGDLFERRCAAFLDEDGIYGHMAAALGFKDVTSIFMERRRSADLLDDMLETTVQRRSVEALGTMRRQFDVVLHPKFSEARSPASALSLLAGLLRPDGQILLRVELFQRYDRPIMVPIDPMQSPLGPLTTVIMTWTALEALLVGAGFVDVEVLDSFMNKLGPEQAAKATAIARQFHLDPENLLSTVLVRARYSPLSGVMTPTAAELDDAWMFARALWTADPANVAADAPLRRLADRQRASLTAIDSERSIMRGALADRESDLADARQQLQTALTEAAKLRLDYHVLQGTLADRETDLASARSELHAALRDTADAKRERDILVQALSDR